jgi:hypothetical protein
MLSFSPTLWLIGIFKEGGTERERKRVKAKEKRREKEGYMKGERKSGVDFVERVGSSVVYAFIFPNFMIYRYEGERGTEGEKKREKRKKRREGRRVADREGADMEGERKRSGFWRALENRWYMPSFMPILNEHGKVANT